MNAEFVRDVADMREINVPWKGAALPKGDVPSPTVVVVPNVAATGEVSV